MDKALHTFPKGVCSQLDTESTISIDLGPVQKQAQVNNGKL